VSSNQEESSGPSALRGKRLLVVFGSYRSKRHIYEHARALGVRLTVLDGPDHWMSGCAGPSGLIERHLAVDLSPFETFAERAVLAVRESGLALDGIGTIDEFAGGFAARIAADLRLPFHSIEAADRARDKHRTREACAAAGIEGPRFARIESAGQIERAAAIVGFPAVLKPVSGVGSVQTYRIDTMEDLIRRHDAITAQVRSARGRARRALGSDRDWFDLMWSGNPHLTLESWIEGRKYDIDLLLDSGRLIYAHATDDLQPFGLRDVRRLAPSGLATDVEAELIDHAAACVRAIGFRRGAFNVEVKRTARGPRMIEVNGRMGGYSTTDIHKEVWGVDLIDAWLRIAMGLPAEVMEKTPATSVAESLLPAPRSGKVARDGFLDSLKAESRVLEARQWVFAGDVVTGVETGAPDWMGAVLTRAARPEEALAELDRIVATLDLPVISGGDWE
jgi:carnosine synthase